MTPTEERIFARCIEEGDCWIWQGAVSGGVYGGPCVNWGGKTQRVRKMLWEEKYGRKPNPGWVIAAKCCDRMCVSPVCAVHVTNRRMKQMAAAHGAYSSMDKIRRGLATKRATSWITDEVVARVKAARTAKEAHEATGVSLSWAKVIRRGTGRVEFSNPFAGLGAANEPRRRAA